MATTWEKLAVELMHAFDNALFASSVSSSVAMGGCTPALAPASKLTIHAVAMGGIGDQLVTAMKQAKANGTPEQAELVACEAVVLAETKDHSNWDLLDHVAKHDKGPHVSVLKAAVEEVEEDEDHHLYQTKGWCRELWVQALGFPAVLPPPEEIKQVETAIGAARAEQSRDDMLKVHA